MTQSRREGMKLYYAKRREERKQYAKDYYKKNRERVKARLIANYHKRAAAAGKKPPSESMDEKAERIWAKLKSEEPRPFRMFRSPLYDL